MAARDVVTEIGTYINSGLGRILKGAFEEGFDNDILLAYGNRLRLEDSNGDYKEIYMSTTTLTIPATANYSYADGISAIFGDGSDVTMSWDGTDFDILPAADDSVIKFGNGTLNFDIWVYGNTVDDNIIFDASGNILNFDGVDIQLEDADILYFGDSKDVQVRWDGTDLDILALADDQVIKFGNGTNSFDIWVYGNTANDNIIFDASGNIINFDGIDIQVEDGDIIEFGDDKDVTMTFDGTTFIVGTIADDVVIEIGDAATPQLSFDVKWYANEAGGASYLYGDASANLIYTTGIDIQIKDNDYLVIGSGAGAAGDVNIHWDTTNLIIDCAADDTLIEIGDSAATQLSFDLKWYGNDNNGASYLYADASENLIYTTGVDVQFKDSDWLVFGTGAGAAGDVGITFDGTSLIIGAQTDDLLIEIGDANATQKSFDVRIYGNAANGADYFQFDAGDSALKQGGAAEIQLGRFTRASVAAKTTDYTVVAADTGKVFHTTGAGGAVVFTLPTLAAGLVYTFVNVADQTMTIASASGNDMVTFNDAAASSVAFSTASEKIGAVVTVIATATAWFVLQECTNTMTVA